MLTASIKPGVSGTRRLQARFGEPHHIRKRHIAKRMRTCPSNGARHVRHAVVDDAFLDISRLRVSCRTTGLDAAPLVDTDINDDRARLHHLEVFR